MKNFFKLFFMAIIAILLTAQSGKANDTITIQLPGGIHNICVNPGNLPTFVLYKPNGFGGTVWAINSVYYGTGDSIVYTPTTVQSYSFGATWDGNVEGVTYYLYSSPPSHATFEIFGGGNINTTNDTAYMCGMSGLSLGANALGGGSFTWYGPSGFTSTNNPITVTTPGIYVFERPNACGITHDSVEVIYLPTTIPVWTDTTFCNVSVSLTLDPGAGWDYSWNTGATTQSITVTDTGYYHVGLSNQCATGSVDIHVSHETYPEPSLFAYEGFYSCNHATQTMNPSLGFTYDTYDWSTGATTPTITVGAPSANYSVTVTVGGCTSVTPDASILFYPLLTTPSICIATVNAASGYNDVWFEPIDPLANVQGAENYKIYKLAGTYSLIGTVPASASAMVFTDSTSTPMVSAARYKISVVDTCGDESVLSYGHGTIKINSNPGTGGVVDLTIVDSYWDESGTYSPSKYYILVDSLNNGNLAVMDSVDAVFNSYTVLQPYLGATYRVGVALPNNCGAGKNIAQSMSLSNKSMTVQSISENGMSTVHIFPNPATNQITISGVETGGTLRLYDLSGKLLLERVNSNNTLELVGIAAGSYVLEVRASAGSGNENKVVRGRVVVE